MENKVWYKCSDFSSYSIKGIKVVILQTLHSHTSEIEETIKLQMSHMRWPGMWSLMDTKRRLVEGHVLYLLRDHKGALGHLWIDDNYIYNVYVNPRRLNGQSKAFVKGCMAIHGAKEYNLFCDEWNTRAQNFFEKVGFTRNDSYI